MRLDASPWSQHWICSEKKRPVFSFRFKEFISGMRDMDFSSQSIRSSNDYLLLTVDTNKITANCKRFNLKIYCSLCTTEGKKGYLAYNCCSKVAVVWWVWQQQHAGHVLLLSSSFSSFFSVHIGGYKPTWRCCACYVNESSLGLYFQLIRINSQ